MSTSRPGPRQRVRIVEVAEFGPEPVGEAQSFAIEGYQLRTAGGQAAGNDHPSFRGVGDPAWSVAADLGPLQAFGPVRTVPSKNTAFKGFGGALPATSGGANSIQDQLAGLGI